MVVNPDIEDDSIVCVQNRGDLKTFEVDRVFGPRSTQREVIVKSTLKPTVWEDLLCLTKNAHSTVQQLLLSPPTEWKSTMVLLGQILADFNTITAMLMVQKMWFCLTYTPAYRHEILVHSKVAWPSQRLPCAPSMGTLSGQLISMILLLRISFISRFLMKCSHYLYLVLMDLMYVYLHMDRPDLEKHLLWRCVNKLLLAYLFAIELLHSRVQSKTLV